jgi:hypothetical protein
LIGSLGIAVFVVVLLLVIAALVAVLVVQRRSAEKVRAAQAQQPGPRRDPFADVNETAGDVRTVKVGDLLEYMGTRFFVRGSVLLKEGGYVWREHFLDDVAGTRRWLSVEEDPDLEVVLWEEIDAESLNPSEKTLTWDGVEYRRDEHGTATYTAEGTTGLGATGRVEYADFEGAGGRYLSFERFDGGSWDVGLGERVPAGTLTVYPAS